MIAQTDPGEEAGEADESLGGEERSEMEQWWKANADGAGGSCSLWSKCSLWSVTEANGLLPSRLPLPPARLPPSWWPLVDLLCRLPAACVPPSTYRTIRLVFPTPLSPTSATLTSGGAELDGAEAAAGMRGWAGRWFPVRSSYYS